MTKELDSVCPIFVRYENDNIEQVGSGALLEIKNQLFLLTAAHVSDWSERGDLCIPTRNGIEAIIGYMASVSVPKGLSRNQDKIDMSYYRLDDDLVNNMHEELSPLCRSECWLTDNTLPDDVYTFSGFPLSKSKNYEDALSTEMFSYSGVSAIPEKYNKLGYRIDNNIVVNFRRKQSVEPNGAKRIPPHPKGISGGPIFRWPKYVGEKPEKFQRSLVGISHTYLQQHNCLIGTRLSLYYRFISNNNPGLFEDDINEEEGGIPLFVAFVFYKKEEWSLLKSQFDDADHMQNSWPEWRNAAENGIEQMHRKGLSVIPIELSAKEITEYCKSRKISNVGKTRGRLASEKMVEMLRESKLLPT